MRRPASLPPAKRASAAAGWASRSGLGELRHALAEGVAVVRVPAVLLAERAGPSSARSALHLAAFTVFWRASSELAFAFEETHLPKAFRWFGPVP